MEVEIYPKGYGYYYSFLTRYIEEDNVKRIMESRAYDGENAANMVNKAKEKFQSEGDRILWI